MNILKSMIISRHGATAYNDNHLLQGRTDVMLSEKGIHEAVLLAKYLKNEKIDVIYYTPLIRSKQTAEIVNQFHNVSMACMDHLIEMDMGEYEGKNFPELIERNQEFYYRWITDPEERMPGGESFNDVFARVKTGIEAIMASPFRDILIIGHAMTNRAIIGNLLDIPPKSSRRFRTGNCSVSRVTAMQSSQGIYLMMDTWNHMEHIDSVTKTA
ncbi:MAG: histidine phosphatase family protein [Candidatus Omnitrophota bacterium]